MQYPLISEYKEAILNANDNFNKLTYLRPVLDTYGEPVMSSGNFAVVFKMTDGDKYYAIKCFIKEQKGRAEAYRKICQYLPSVPSPYLVHIEYIEKELFVDTNQSKDEEFPILVMDWVEGLDLDSYMKTINDNEAKRTRLANEFRELTFWLLNQEFAHGDLKPDNIIVTDNGKLVLVDYDGMFVPCMRGQKSRELGTPLYRYKGRTQEEFDEFSDDYACIFIMLVLMRNIFAPIYFGIFTSADTKHILQQFSDYYGHLQMAPYIAAFLLVASCGRIDRQILYPLLAHRSNNTSICPSMHLLPLSYTINGVYFEMIYVEGGTFVMGATAEQGPDAESDERPAHKVTLSSYAIGKYTVTQALWKAVMGENPSYFKGDSLPVEQVSWDDCQEFIKKLNNITGKTFRLPTEAEWEFAARGGNSSKGYKYSGSNNVDEVAWYTCCSDLKTHPVGTKNPNELGIFDMSGNVWEACSDCYQPYSSSVLPSHKNVCHVYRGGGWHDGFHVEYCDEIVEDDGSFGCRVSCRNNDKCIYRFNSLGLRLVLSLEKTAL